MTKFIQILATAFVILIAFRGAAGADIEVDEPTCKARLALNIVESDGIVSIECLFECQRGLLQLKNPFLNRKQNSHTSLTLQSADGRRSYPLVEVSSDAAKTAPETIVLGESQCVGRRFVLEDSARVPDGVYRVSAEYVEFASEAPSRRQPQLRTVKEGVSIKLEKKLNSSDISNVALKDRHPLAITIAVDKHKAKLDEKVAVSFRLENTSADFQWGYNLWLNPLLSDRVVNLEFCDAAGTALLDIMERTDGSFRSPALSDWQQIPPGGIVGRKLSYRVRSFTTERELLRPYGQYTLQAKVYSQLLGMAPRDVKGGVDSPSRTDRTLTLGEWKRLIPGVESSRSNLERIEVVPSEN